MRRLTFLVILGALALVGCDYGYADGEDPAAYDDGTGTLEYGLRADDEPEAGVEADRFEQPGLSTTGAPAISVGYVTSTGTAPVSSLPVQHPDPKPWKK